MRKDGQKLVWKPLAQNKLEGKLDRKFTEYTSLLFFQNALSPLDKPFKYHSRRDIFLLMENGREENISKKGFLRGMGKGEDDRKGETCEDTKKLRYRNRGKQNEK